VRYLPLVALAFLSMGIVMPRFVTTITFEPVANIALIYTQSMLKTNPDTVNERITYQPMEMSDDGFYRPQLRDTIIMLMKTTITQFQSYMKLGIAVMDKAFSLDALYGIGAQILRQLGATKIRLLTNKPEKKVGLKAFDIEIIEIVGIENANKG
jgi:hypothetical protein